MAKAPEVSGAHLLPLTLHLCKLHQAIPVNLYKWLTVSCSVKPAREAQ
jgi:hypothetical protein